MNAPQAHSNGGTPISRVVLPDDLIAEILSFLEVKSLMRFRCVSKSWNSLISNPSFVKMHLNRSARNSHLTLVWCESIYDTDCSIVPLSLSRLLEEEPPSITFVDDPYYRLKDKDCFRVIGCCNGLICLHGTSSTTEYRENWLYFWNPATRSMSKKLGFFGHDRKRRFSCFKFTFGYDNSTGTYKVVAWTRRNEVRVFSLGDNVWKNIQSFPVVPFDHTSDSPITLPGVNDGVYLNGTINWLAIRNNFSYDWENITAEQFSYDWENITVEQFVIISLDLGTEAYRQLLLPRGFDEVPFLEPAVVVLKDCLCFSHDFQETHFVIWQMKEFRVEKSWTQFFKISYQNLQTGCEIGDFEHHFHSSMLPLCLFENSDTLILASHQKEHAILYNWRDNSVKRTAFTNEIWWFYAKDYVESLVSTC